MNDGILGLIIGAIAGTWFGWTITYTTLDGDYQKQAIEHGCAGYNSKTGKFMWNMEKLQ